jgi:3-isopropylmalate dehydratase small subunit
VRLIEMVEGLPAMKIVVDLESSTVMAGDLRFSFTMPDSDRHSLLSGNWDTTSVLLANAKAIKAAARRIPYVNGFHT